MKVGVGYCDNPDSAIAGRQAAERALADAGRSDVCDLILLFCTATHNQEQLREAVISVVGNAPVYGGGAVGIITNEAFGYGGNQAGIACIWLEGAECSAFIEGGLLESEFETGKRLGGQLNAHQVTPDSSVVLFYDAIDRTKEGVRLLMATWLLEGMKNGLGFLPALTGAGVQGDHVCTPIGQYMGDKITQHQALALAFSDDIRIDSVIMHGCRPASTYYTVTKSEGPVILEINNKPAIPFIDEVLQSAIKPEEYPFFLLFGINHGGTWDEYDENNYASRLCLAIDKERDGIVMFEPDMVEETKFQLMFRSLDLDYMKPKVESLFEQLDGREPIFALYIDCAGRCAGYGGVDIEDALVIQETVNGRVPVLGLYTGVEIAPIGGQPRGLDWTGVFCLFSQAGSETKKETKTTVPKTVWEDKITKEDTDDVPAEALVRLCEQNAAKILKLDVQSIAIRHELEQKRRGFSLLAELSVSLNQSGSNENAFTQAAKRINAALNMQRTVVLIPKEDGSFRASVLQGYSIDDKIEILSQPIYLAAELQNSKIPVIVTAADSEERLAGIRKTLKLPYFISAPVIIQNNVVALLITGRVTEQTPFLSRLGISDQETVQAISSLLASIITHQRLEAAEERTRIIVDAMPLSCIFWNENGDLIDCNEEAIRMFGFENKEEFLESFDQMVPDVFRPILLDAFVKGTKKLEWEYVNKKGEVIPAEVTLVRVPTGEDYSMAGYVHDLRGQKAAMVELQSARDMAEENVRIKNEFLASVSHEIRTPLNAIMAMARAASEMEVKDEAKQLVEKGVLSVQLLNAQIDSILDFSRIESGDIELEARPFSVEKVLSSVTGLLAGKAEEKNLSLRVETNADMPEEVIGDVVRFEQILFNITSNAIKFTEEGGVSIHTNSNVDHTAGKVRLVVEVRDTGIGISEERQGDLFRPLTPMDTSYSRKQKGLGMGLAVSKGLVQLMGGTIEYQAAADRGSIFIMTFMFDLPQKETAEKSLPASEQYKDLEGMHVLVVEDNLINQIIIAEILTKTGINVTTKDNGLEALEVLEKEMFDLVLMDIQMPEMDGLTATVKIRENSKFDQMPILAMTAHSSEEHRRESKESGMDAHLTKPIQVEEVYETLQYWRTHSRKG